ncbi:nucleotidyltransferase family protein [Veronia pacifica]|uniref:nucleotidyltransferase family protein n=1 Tax=Veronia pacifica TaxID=1080227 RepID=UPI001C30B10C|nr:nucleotidyltransferase family protein [Veronia pacifica]
MEKKVRNWIANDELRFIALKTAATLNLPQWCIAAGFVRNLIWDKLHGHDSATPLSDIDMIYFNKEDTSEETDKKYEDKLKAISPLSWSVKNQARMHNKIHVSPYESTLDAMSFWPEIETAIGAYLNPQGDIGIITPFNLEQQVSTTVTVNSRHPSPNTALLRAKEKGWLTLWPELKIHTHNAEVTS